MKKKPGLSTGKTLMITPFANKPCSHIISTIADLGTRSFFPDSLSAHLNSMDRYRSIAHFADFQVRSSLNRSQKNSGLLSLAGGKHNLTRQILSA